MRILLGRVKVCFYTLLALCICVGCFWLLRMGRVSALSSLQGERTFFLDSASSQALVKNQLSVVDVFRVKGESVRFSLSEFDGGRYQDIINIDGQVCDEIAGKIGAEYAAELIFSENASGIQSYYFYSAELPYGILLNGRKVNLHVAIDGDMMSVGTPIIFGGF